MRAWPQELVGPDQTEMTVVPEPGVKTAFINQVRDSFFLSLLNFLSQFEAAGLKTMAEVWDWSVCRYRQEHLAVVMLPFYLLSCRYGDKQLMGTREVLGEEDEEQDSGKMFTKLELGEYKWLNYTEVSVGLVNREEVGAL